MRRRSALSSALLRSPLCVPPQLQHRFGWSVGDTDELEFFCLRANSSAATGGGSATATTSGAAAARPSSAAAAARTGADVWSTDASETAWLRALSLLDEIGMRTLELLEVALELPPWRLRWAVTAPPATAGRDANNGPLAASALKGYRYTSQPAGELASRAAKCAAGWKACIA